METNQTSLFNQSGPGYYESSYVNSVQLHGEELKVRQLKAGSQEAIVLNFFTITPPYKFSACQVTRLLHAQGERMIKDSVKRSISMLCGGYDKKKKVYKPAYLRKTNDTIIGEHGHSVHTYELINKPK